MRNRYLLTPFFLNEPVPGLEELAGDTWVVNQAGPDRFMEAKEPGARMEGMRPIHRYLAEWTFQTAAAGRRPISVAGDCCTSIAFLAGLQQAGLDPLLIWFDAHGDFNTWETTPSGFLGGMPLAMLVGRGDQRLCQAVELSLQPEDQVMLVGARDLDPGEIENLSDSALEELPDVRDLPHASLGSRPIWVHFDTDVLRLEDAPAMNYPAEGGPSLDDLRAAFRHIAKTGLVAAVSMSTWNPTMAGADRSRDNSMGLLELLLA